MTGCDKCGCFANELKSLDGFTLLCSSCEMMLLQQKSVLKSNPPTMSIEVELVWKWLTENSTPLHMNRTDKDLHVTCYGSRELYRVMELVEQWSIRSICDIPVSMIEFGAPTTDIDIDGTIIKTSARCFEKDQSLLTVEEYGCWVKVQLYIKSSAVFSI